MIKNILAINLLTPPAAQTESTVAIVWDKPKTIFDKNEIKEYQVFIDGKIFAITNKTDYTINGLKSNTEYEVFVRVVLDDAATIYESNSVKVFTKPQTDIYNILDYGAVGDGKTLNTQAIQKTIDACTYGGKVYIPKGIFVSGAIFLKSNMTLFFDEGAVLFGSGNVADYPLMNYRFEGRETLCYASLINTKEPEADRLENISICGNGKINANGSILRRQELMNKDAKPGRALCLRKVDNVYLNEITVRQSPAWCVHLIYCNHVSINDVKIHTKYNENGRKYSGIANGDGLDPDSSSNIFIFNSLIASQDDCIAIKSGRDAEGRAVGIPSENIRISNCKFESGFGVAIGSEMSGGVKNVLVQDCVFDNTFSIASVKAPRGRGGVVENIKYEDCTLRNANTEHRDGRWFRGALYVDEFYSYETFDTKQAEKIDDSTPTIKDIYFDNIFLYTVGGNAIYIVGLPERHLENIQLQNITAIGKYGMKSSNVDGLVMENVSVYIKGE